MGVGDEIPEGEIKVTALYVLRQLQEHTKECSRRWWSVMAWVIANLVALVGGMATVITMLATRGHS